MKRTVQGSRKNAVAFSLTLLLLACDDGASGRRVWRATDHDHDEISSPAAEQAANAPQAMQDLSGAAPAAPDSSTSPSPHGSDAGQAAAAMQYWAANCTRCHGRVGAGDGPDGPRVMARNLTDPNWQSGTSDGQIASSILNGRGMMPPFPGAASVMGDLVQLIRQMGGMKPQPSSANSAGVASPEGAQVTPSAPAQAP